MKRILTSIIFILILNLILIGTFGGCSRKTSIDTVTKQFYEKDIKVTEMTQEQKITLKTNGSIDQIMDYEGPIDNYEDYMDFVTNHEYTVIRVKVLNEPRENKNESVFYNKSDNHTVTKVKVLDVYKPGKSKVKKNDTIKIVENYYIDAWDGELIIQYPRPYMLTPILESNKEYILFIEPYNFSYYNELDENLEDREKWHSLAIQGAYLISSSKNILPCMEMEEYKAILKGIKKEFLNES